MDARENILLIRLKSIGDILFTLPAVHVVRENFPNAKLHFLVSKEHAPILRGFSEIDEIIPFDREIFRSKNHMARGKNFFQLLRRLRKKKFSLAIDFQGYGETEWLSWWSGAPERWGNSYNPSRGWLFTRASEFDLKMHPAEWNLFLLRRCDLGIGGIHNDFFLPDDSLDEARIFFAANHLETTQPTLFIQPFTSAAHKNWPLEKFLQLARHFRSRGRQVIFGGGPGERKKLKSAGDAGFCVAAGTSLLVSGGLTKLSSLVVGADTGLLHLAVAMGKRVVMIMKSNQPGTPHPFQHADWTITSSAKTVSEIQTEIVIEHCERVFQ